MMFFLLEKVGNRALIKDKKVGLAERKRPFGLRHCLHFEKSSAASLLLCIIVYITEVILESPIYEQII